MQLRTTSIAAALFLCAVPALAGEEHRIEIELKPQTAEITGSDRIVTQSRAPYVFELNSGLAIDASTVDGRTVAPERVADDGWLTQWRLPLGGDPAGTATIVLHYAGKIEDRVKKSATLGFVVGDDTRGVICEEGVYLSEGSGWYPVGESMARFDILAKIPEPYLVVTQGTHKDPAGFWTGKYDADGVSLVAGKWKHEERKTASGVVVGTYLSEGNAGFAKLLLDSTESYLKTYSELLGPYAYDRFDVVENWFTTGYGMPEFTLLGRDVIARMAAESQRLGAIPSGYLDHEVVHCWWGNLVFPDYASGNWCEGLTSYCANYHSKEALSPEEAREYRRRTSLRFTIRATPQRDYPVRRFRGKTEDVDDDIGYGKCSMIFHALRRDLGEQPFWDTLRRVSKDFRGKRFSWADWQREFEISSGRKLQSFFDQGLDRTGAPLFSVTGMTVSADAGRLRVSGTLLQSVAAGEKAWRVTVPVVVEHLEGREETLVDCNDASTSFSLLVPSLPLRVIVDPDFHVFRRLAVDEVPPCLASLLERPAKLMIYPDGDDALKAAAEMAAGRAGGKAVAASQAPREMPRGTSALVFGDADRVPLLASLKAVLPRHFPSSRATATTTVLATARSPSDENEFVTTFVGAPEILAKRARAVFYYQYDGRIVFDGSAPRERAQVPAANHAARTLLPDVLATSSPETVRDIVDRLASPEMNGRLAGGPEEKKVRALVREQLTLAGLEVDEQPFRFSVRSLDPARPALLRDGQPVAGALPLVASPTTGDKPVALAGVTTEPEGDVAGRALLFDLGEATENPLETLRSVADLAKSRGALALIVRLPAPAAKPADRPAAPGRSPFADLTTFARETADGAAPAVPAYAAAGVAARTGATRELSLPAVIVPHEFDPKAAGSLTIDVAFQTKEIASANVVGRVKALGKRRQGVVLLGAHFDHLGAGFPGADDDASGVAALTEAARMLAANANLLGRDVLLVAFGAEEWGLRGSKAFVDAWPKDQPIVGMIQADTVGRRGIPDVNVVGVSKHPRLAQVVAAALEQANLDVGRDIDRMAFAHGSDHWTFHEAGIPAVDLWSGDYAVMHTSTDTAEGVDEKKVARIGRAMALAAIAVAGGF